MVEKKSFILVGGPNSGKSNYLARLWLALQSKNFNLVSLEPPDDLDYIDGIARHILQGEFVPRTEPMDKDRNFRVTVKSNESGKLAEIVVPDLLGEIWNKAVSTLEIPARWFDALQIASGAIIFVRVHSPSNVMALDWVTCQGLLKSGLIDSSIKEIPTQVVLMELLRFIDENIYRDDSMPKVAVVVTAWDLLHKEEGFDSPDKYLMKEFPMFYGRLIDIKSLDIKIFGSSIVGGDLQIPAFHKTFLEGQIERTGYVVTSGSDFSAVVSEDITAPLGWLIE